MTCGIAVGQRFVCDGHHGTVKYVGEVPPTKGQWLGVEWDDPTRGKHNGTHEGTTYYTTKHPTSGSFIRPKKANFGIPITTALKERYGKVDGENAGVITEDMFVYGDKNQLTEVEVVGMKALNERQSKFDALLEVALRGSNINGASNGNLLRTLAPQLEELDISNNLIRSWEEVSRIACQLSYLKILVLSDNRLEIPDNPETLKEAFTNVKVLLLNKMELTWDDVLQSSKMWPDIEELYVCFNHILECSLPCGPTFQSLGTLNLEGNSLKDWRKINHLGSLPKLHTLLLNDTELENIWLSEDPCDKHSPLFPALKSLSLSDNKIAQWTHINELNKLTIEEIRFSRNPLIETTSPATARQWLAAKIKSLKNINRTEVTKDERKGSELDYLKKNGQQWRDAGGHQEPAKNNPSQQFTNEHPRYQELITVWGPPEDSEMKVVSGALKHSLLHVSIFSPQMPERVPLKKKLPGSMTVQKVKTLVQRLFKVDTSDIRLSYISKTAGGPEISMDNDLRQISFYAIETDDTLCVKW